MTFVSGFNRNYLERFAAQQCMVMNVRYTATVYGYECVPLDISKDVLQLKLVFLMCMSVVFNQTSERNSRKRCIAPIVGAYDAHETVELDNFDQGLEQK